MINFCSYCGSKVEDHYNYCINCGKKIDRSDIKQHNSFNIKKELIKEIKMEKDRTAKVKEITRTEKEMSSEEIKGNEIIHGGYCNLSCRHCFEEFFDSEGSIEGDYSDGGYVEYYCSLGHTVFYGSFCEDYE